ncbi:hypothetical protein AOLI_G00316500 [Acnodon oligacanthus]
MYVFVPAGLDNLCLLILTIILLTSRVSRRFLPCVVERFIMQIRASWQEGEPRRGGGLAWEKCSFPLSCALG